MNEENIINNNIKDNVLKKIECGQVQMKSRMYFNIKIGLLIAISLFVFFISIFLVSYLIFCLKTGGFFFLLGFGTKGFYKFFLLLPWIILVVNAFLLILLDYLLRRFKFGYHSPLVYLFLGTLVFVTLFSTLVNFTSFHDDMMKFTQRRKIPFAGWLYGGIKRSYQNHGVVVGKVSSIGDGYLVITHHDYDRDYYDNLKILTSSNLLKERGISIGDSVIVAGDFISKTELSAFGMHKISE